MTWVFFYFDAARLPEITTIWRYDGRFKNIFSLFISDLWHRIFEIVLLHNSMSCLSSLIGSKLNPVVVQTTSQHEGGKVQTKKPVLRIVRPERPPTQGKFSSNI